MRSLRYAGRQIEKLRRAVAAQGCRGSGILYHLSADRSILGEAGCYTPAVKTGGVTLRRRDGLVSGLLFGFLDGYDRRHNDGSD